MKHLLPCVDTAEAVENMDVFVELTRTYLKRASAVSALTPLEAINTHETTSSNRLLGNTNQKCNQSSFEGLLTLAHFQVSDRKALS
ncbi:hypothetical protein JK628_15975 [Shewanella sp. KX20019]|uniref:hypothetical protein n=1 Tax=Shewanella sp. KX20019 TaxID=2803864 RepID=UPI00192696BA|nr:hypothetical protein [Shewanella sp. KX20019]QQX79049.1 hypothetical protein JK628_15975 [Shewanella sp. KX20019]